MANNDQFDQGRNSPVQLFEILLNAVHLDSATHAKVSALLYSAPHHGRDLTTQRRLLGELQIEAEGLLHRQKRVLAVITIQKAIRAYNARKTYAAYKKIYVKERNTQVHDLISREVAYNRLINQLSQRYVVPLLNTPDKLLKEESSDFGELLQALLKIERLHRGLLRKFKWFIEEGCAWPNVDGFGTIFLNLKEEFLAYGDFIQHFKYTIDILDQLDVGEIERPRLNAFLTERSFDNVGFKALVTKPLNQIASYELGLREMADVTSPDDPDFKTLMTALSIMFETNKHINKCLTQSYETAKIKKLSQRLVFKSNKEQPDLEKIWKDLMPTAQYIEELNVEVLMKTRVKKKVTAGTIFFFSNMMLVTTPERNGLNKTKRIFPIPQVKVEALPSFTLQFTALQDDREIFSSALRVRCESQLRTNELREKLEQLKEATQMNRVFAVALDTLLEREGNTSGVPFVVQTLCKFLLNNVETVGLFRIPGSAQVEKVLRAAFNEKGGNNVELADYNPSPADAAGILKLYFRELPTPLCGNLFVKFVETQKNYKEDQIDEMLAELQSIVAQLKANSRKTLQYVCEFMHEIAKHKEVNKMSSSNVAMCVGPDLMKPPVDSIELALMVPQANEALALMVEYPERVFV